MAEPSFMKSEMIAKALVLVEPTNFQINPETINDNQYMQSMPESPSELQAKVLKEHRNYQEALKQNSIDFRVYKQVHEKAYDSIFTCDWIGGIRNEDFPEGILFVFPVRWPTRRLEKNYELVNDLRKDFKHFEDLSSFEERDLALESFGTMSIDFHNRIVYINLSERCHLEPAEHFLSLLNKYTLNGKYRLRKIEGVDPKTHQPCFHTGLYLAFNNDTVFYCKEFVADKNDAEELLLELSSKYEFKYNVVLLTYEETLKMCANVIEVKLENKKNGLLMSKVSFGGYSPENLQKLKEKHEIIVVDMDTINHCAGGSLRCMASMLF